MSMQLPTFQTFSMGQVNEAENYHWMFGENFSNQHAMAIFLE